jgi:hypothetical protein
MKCRYCNIALAPLRTLTDGEFCCDEHRQAYLEHGGPLRMPSLQEAGLVPLSEAIGRAASPALEPNTSSSFPVDFRPKSIAAPAFSAQADPRLAKPWFHLPERLLALGFKRQMFNSSAASQGGLQPEAEFPARPVMPGVGPEPIGDIEAAFLAGEEENTEELGEPRFQHMEAWHKAPSELSIVTVLLPILLALAVSPSLPKMRITAGNGVERMLSDHWSTFNKSVSDRAAIAYTDDFRAGLDGWESRSNLTTSWSYDATGFVRPGPLAVFRPTVDLTDYRLEFLAEIDQKGLGCAFRAPNLDNYYAVKFKVVQPGPLPVVHVVRYAVIGGKEGPHVEHPLPLTVRADMLYRIRVDVRGSDFALMAQGQMVDFWSDSRIPRGGVGLFCGHGEKARVRWLEVSHQYDTLGRLCAYLAPYGIEGRNGNLN